MNNTEMFFDDTDGSSGSDNEEGSSVDGNGGNDFEFLPFTTTTTTTTMAMNHSTTTTATAAAVEGVLPPFVSMMSSSSSSFHRSTPLALPPPTTTTTMINKSSRNYLLRRVLCAPHREYRMSVPMEYRYDLSFVLQVIAITNQYHISLPHPNDLEHFFLYTTTMKNQNDDNNNTEQNDDNNNNGNNEYNSHIKQQQQQPSSRTTTTPPPAAAAADVQRENHKRILYALSQRTYDFDKIYYTRLLHVPEYCKDDYNIMLSYVQTIPQTLQDCSDELRDDRTIVMAAIRTNGFVLQYASYRLQCEEEMIRIACIYNHICALQFCSCILITSKLLSDMEFVIDLLHTAGGKKSRPTKEAISSSFVEEDTTTLTSRNGDNVEDDEDWIEMLQQQRVYMKKLLRTRIMKIQYTDISSFQTILLLAIQYRIMSYTDICYDPNSYTSSYITFVVNVVNEEEQQQMKDDNHNGNDKIEDGIVKDRRRRLTSTVSYKVCNDFDFLLHAIQRNAAVYMELIQLGSNRTIKDTWWKSSSSLSSSPIVEATTDDTTNANCHRVAYATITSKTSDATIIQKVLEYIPSFLLPSSKYYRNEQVHYAIVDRADLVYMKRHVTELFPFLLSDYSIMKRAIQRDCNIFVYCTIKDDTNILITAMNEITAYPLLRTKLLDWVFDHIHVLEHVISISSTYEAIAQYIPDTIWKQHINLQKVWIRRKNSILLPCMIQFMNEGIRNVDMKDSVYDFALYIGQYNPGQFKFVPKLLRTDVSFMERAIQRSYDGSILLDGDVTIVQKNMDCAIYTLVSSDIDRHYSAVSTSTTMGQPPPRQYMNLFRYMHHISPKAMNEYLEQQFQDHDTFINPFLCSIHHHYNNNNSNYINSNDIDNAATASSSSGKVVASLSGAVEPFPLSMLNCGIETNTAILQNIASFLHIPIGSKYSIYMKAYRLIYKHLYPEPIVRPSTTNYTTIITGTTNRPNDNVQQPAAAAPAAAQPIPNANNTNQPQPNANDDEDLFEFEHEMAAVLEEELLQDMIEFEEEREQVLRDPPPPVDQPPQEQEPEQVPPVVDAVVLPEVVNAAAEVVQQEPEPVNEMERYLLDNSLLELPPPPPFAAFADDAAPARLEPHGVRARERNRMARPRFHDLLVQRRRRRLEVMDIDGNMEDNVDDDWMMPIIMPGQILRGEAATANNNNNNNNVDLELLGHQRRRRRLQTVLDIRLRNRNHP